MSKQSRADRILGNKPQETIVRRSCGNCLDGWIRKIQIVKISLIDGRPGVPDLVPYEYPMPANYETDEYVVRHYETMAPCGCLEVLAQKE